LYKQIECLIICKLRQTNTATVVQTKSDQIKFLLSGRFNTDPAGLFVDVALECNFIYSTT